MHYYKLFLKKCEKMFNSLSPISHSTITVCRTDYYLRSVKDGWHRQHGDNDEDVCAAAHVAGHNQHLGQSGVEGKLHHHSPCWCQST